MWQVDGSLLRKKGDDQICTATFTPFSARPYIENIATGSRKSDGMFRCQ